MLGWIFSGSIWPRIKWPLVCSLEICIACRDSKFIVEMANSLLTTVIAVTRTHGRVRSVDSSWECILCQRSPQICSMIPIQWSGSDVSGQSTYYGSLVCPYTDTLSPHKWHYWGHHPMTITDLFGPTQRVANHVRASYQSEKFVGTCGDSHDIG